MEASQVILVQPYGLLTLDHESLGIPNVSPTGSDHRDSTHISSNSNISTTSESTPKKPSNAFIVNQSLLILGDLSVNNFLNGAEELFDLFQNSTNPVKPISRATLDEVVRLAIWWFLQACMKSEPLLREGSLFPFAEQDNQILLQEAHISLAKSLWIIQETINLDYGLVTSRSTAGTGIEDNILELSSLRLALLIRIRELIWSMERHGLIPQLSEAVSTLENADTSIRIAYPLLNIDLTYLIAGDDAVTSDKHNRIPPLSTVFPLGDTGSVFHYGRMHVDIFLFTTSSNKQQAKYPAILSAVRGRDEKNISVIIGTQHRFLNLSIGSGWNDHPTWDDVTWLTDINTLDVQLRTGCRLQIKCSPWDFKILREVYGFYHETLLTSQASHNETLIFETDVKSTQYHTTGASSPLSFPTSAIPNCTFRIFENTVLQQAGTGPRQQHRGFRIAVLTPPSVKNLRALYQELPAGQTIQFTFPQEDKSNSTISLKIGPDNAGDSLVLALSSSQQRSTLLAHLTGCFVREQEEVLAKVNVSHFSISTGLEAPIPDQAFDDIPWQSIRVVNRHPTDPDTLGVESSQPVLSESLRIVVDSSKARLTDRLNIGIGVLRMRRNVVASGHQLHVLRQPQEDVTFSLSDQAVASDLPEKLGRLLRGIKTQPSIRTYVFPSISELHLFQSAITGFSVLFDGLADSFSISRRRMIVPIHKEWTAPHARIQILRQGRIFQLVAFFEGFSHGKCMNFALKETDIFQKSTRARKPVLKISDAKFSLPAGREGGFGYETGFVCLDVLDYPEEHNNIYIGFGSDAGK